MRQVIALLLVAAIATTHVQGMQTLLMGVYQLRVGCRSNPVLAVIITRKRPDVEAPLLMPQTR